MCCYLMWPCSLRQYSVLFSRVWVINYFHSEQFAVGCVWHRMLYCGLACWLLQHTVDAFIYWRKHIRFYCYYLLLHFMLCLLSSSVLWRCWLGGKKGIRPVKTEWWSAGVVVCLEWGADLYMAQLIPLPLTVSCFSKIQIGFAFVVLAHPGSPGKTSVKRVCVYFYCYYWLLHFMLCLQTQLFWVMSG